MRTVPVEDARKQLGKLVAEAAAGRPVVVSRRGTQQAVLLGEDEYERLKQIEELASIERFDRTLRSIHAATAQEGLPPSVVEEAIAAARQP